MNSDFISQLFGGQEKGNFLRLLLPMFLGAKGGDLSGLLGKDLGALSSLFSKGDVGTDKGEFPPLFGEKKQDSFLPIGGELWNMLGSFTKQKPEEKNKEK